MPDGPGEGQTVKVVRNGEGGTKRVWKLATRNQTPSGRAPPSALRSRGGRGLPAFVVERTGLRSGTSDAGAGGGPMDGHPWSSLEERFDGGSEQTHPPGSARAASPKVSPRTGRDGSTQVARGSRRRPSSDGRKRGSRRREAGASVPVRARAPGEPPRPLHSGGRPPTSVVPSHPDRSQRTDVQDLRPSRQPTRRSSGSGRGTPRAFPCWSAAFGWQVGVAWRVGRKDGSGIWFREVNSPGWVRWRGDEPQGRAPVMRPVGVDRNAIGQVPVGWSLREGARP
jgi:hypothetical protein